MANVIPNGCNQEAIYVPAPDPCSGGCVLDSLVATANGEYLPPNDGFDSVIVDVPTGGPAVNMPLNTVVDFVDGLFYSGRPRGWTKTSGTNINQVTGGITVGGSSPNVYQRPVADLCSYLLGKTVTFSIIVDDELYSETFEITANTGFLLNKEVVNGLYIWSYRDNSSTFSWSFGNTQTSVDPSSHVIRALKVELGDQQTLADYVNGEWVLKPYPSSNEDEVYIYDTLEQKALSRESW